jgi:hypothetical protein
MALIRKAKKYDEVREIDVPERASRFQTTYASSGNLRELNGTNSSIIEFEPVSHGGRYRT